MVQRLLIVLFRHRNATRQVIERLLVAAGDSAEAAHHTLLCLVEQLWWRRRGVIIALLFPLLFSFLFRLTPLLAALFRDFRNLGQPPSRSLGGLSPPSVQVVNQPRHVVRHAERVQAHRELDAEPELEGVGAIEVGQDRRSSAVHPGIDVGHGQVVVELAHSLRDRLFLILRRPLDVTQRDQLLQSLPGLVRIELSLLWMLTISSRHVVPTRDRLHRRSVGKGLDQGTAIHVSTHGQPEERQDRRRDVEQIGTMHQLV